MRRTDFTKLPVGTKLDNGEVEACPHCGRAGMVEKVDGNTFYVHSEAVGINEERKIEIKWEMCPRPPSPAQQKTSESD